jgi:transcriptional regulator with XRE-family HTH domain
MRLREAREARGISLEQAERETRIIRRYLVALEAEDLDAFPAEVYARGFLRSYASYLGLNAQDLLKLLPKTSGSAPVLEPRTAPQRAPRRRGQARDGRAARRATPHPGRQLPLFVAGGLALAALLGYLAGTTPDPTLVPPRMTAAGEPPSDVTPAGGAPIAGRMPDLVGTHEAEALQRLAELGVTPFVIKVPSREAPAGQVLRQSPAPNTPIGARTVTIIISAGG